MVCVECACKLDLLFDFRERSILTAHLFTNMITVNNDNIIEQTISLQEEEEQQQPVVTESNYNQDNDDDFKIVSSSLFESLRKGKSINDNDDFFLLSSILQSSKTICYHHKFVQLNVKTMYMRVT